jgi:membrane associated rhomboid family serine protease
MDNSSIKDFFGPESIATFSGATGILWAICSAFRLLLRRNPVWLFFLAAMAVAYIGSYVAGTLHGVAAIFLGFVNGCLLFCTSSGLQAGGASAAQGKGPSPVKLSGDSFRFWSSWFE